MDKLTELLSSLATKLGTTVEHLWPKLVSYRLGVCIGTSVLELAALVSGAIVLSLTLKSAQWKEDSPGFAREVVGALVGGALLLVGTISFCSDLPGAVGMMMSPEGGTTAWLMDQIRFMR